MKVAEFELEQVLQHLSRFKMSKAYSRIPSCKEVTIYVRGCTADDSFVTMRGLNELLDHTTECGWHLSCNKIDYHGFVTHNCVAVDAYKICLWI
ncbi:hypothetical protein AVEN_197652-1 [Araneus ventricosus]|uniref:Uncharacterized protein n=1 Tax=Araneus ventricosus TaxID=182803 RepID=A0A4Y2SHP7_ARAVE|nr:hypothetical protein AVEN_197652-1 [Araneus ventricosus]